MCHKDKRSPSFHWILRWGDILTGDQGSGSVAIYIMVVQSYWNVVQITICVFSAMAFVVCGYFGQYARGETGRRSVPWKEWDNLEPQTSEIPYGRWSALCPPVYFRILCLINKKKNSNLFITSCVIEAMNLKAAVVQREVVHALYRHKNGCDETATD